MHIRAIVQTISIHFELKRHCDIYGGMNKITQKNICVAVIITDKRFEKLSMDFNRMNLVNTKRDWGTLKLYLFTIKYQFSIGKVRWIKIHG